MNDSEDIILFHATFDIGNLNTLVEQSGDLNDNEQMFGKLSELQNIKDDLKSITDQIAGLETEIKGIINGRAKALYGVKWQSISGDNYKINKKATGALYDVSPDIKPDKKFLKVVTSIDSDTVKTFIKDNSKLPKGIDYNPNRGETISIKIKTPKE